MSETGTSRSAGLWLSQALAALGQLTPARHQFAAYRDAVADDQWLQLRDSDDVAFFHILMGDYDAAIGVIERDLSRGRGAITPSLLENPYFDPLRDDPHFQELVENW